MQNRVINIVAFSIFALLWVAFGAALIFNRELLGTIWQSFRGWPLILQIIVGLLILPVILGLWIWQTAWPLWLRLILVVGLGFVTLYVFSPWKTNIQTDTSLPKS